MKNRIKNFFECAWVGKTLNNNDIYIHFMIDWLITGHVYKKK
jgi:hypothetical protein